MEVSVIYKEEYGPLYHVQRALGSALERRALPLGLFGGPLYDPEVQLTELPRRLTQDDYNATRAMLIERYRATPGVFALLEFGTIPYPGISDMDFFAVVEPGTTVVLPHFSSYTDLNASR